MSKIPAATIQFLKNEIAKVEIKLKILQEKIAFLENQYPEKTKNQYSFAEMLELIETDRYSARRSHWKDKVLITMAFNTNFNGIIIAYELGQRIEWNWTPQIGDLKAKDWEIVNTIPIDTQGRVYVSQTKEVRVNENCK